MMSKKSGRILTLQEFKMVEVIGNTVAAKEYRRPIIEERLETADWSFPDEVNLVNRAFEVKKNHPGLKYSTLNEVEMAAYDWRYRNNRFHPEYLTEDLESIAGKLLWTANLHDLREGQRGIRRFFGYTKTVPLFRGLDVEALIDILYRTPEGLRVIAERVREQTPPPSEGKIIEQRDGETHLVLVPENGSKVTPSSNTKLERPEVFVAASMLLDLDRKPNLNPHLHGRLVSRLYSLGISNRLQAAVQATQSSNAELFMNPALCQNLYAKLLAIANHNVDAPVLNRDNRAASLIVDVFLGVISDGVISDEDIREFLSPGLTLVKKAPKA